MKKALSLFLIFNLFIFSLSSETFNSKLTQEERDILQKGEVLIRNIDFYRNICLDMSENEQAEEIKSTIHKLQPKYLAEVIQFKPYKGNEDLPEKLSQFLYNVNDYAGIPYFSERTQSWWDLYDSAEIVSEKVEGNLTELNCIFQMSPFGSVDEKITIKKTDDYIIYSAVNMSKMRYYDKFDCVFPEKMKMCIYLFKENDNWILYGIGGVNAPRIPFFTERIETSFINRIKTFCNYIFEQL